MIELDRLRGVEVRHFAALEAVASARSFGRAAARLGYTQSAVSHQIAALERIVGQRLVDRPGGPRPVALTEAGELLLVHAHEIVARLHAAQADVVALEEGAAGVARVGVYQSAGAHVLPRLLRAFSVEWPRMRIRLVEAADSFALLDVLEAGELDVSFADLPVPTERFESTELVVDPYVLLVEAGSPLAGRGEPPALEDVAALPLIAYRQSRGRGVEGYLVSRGYAPEIVFRSDDSGTVQGLVAAGVGAAIVPLLTVDTGDEDVAVLGLGDQVPARVIGLAWCRGRYQSPPARAFVEVARRVSACA